jgi:HRI1 protein
VSRGTAGNGAIPDPFVGAWRRVSITLGDGPPDEPSDVVWLQARCRFADLRLPRRRGVEPVAFAGVTSWDAPALTWHHRLDLAASAPDVGVMEWRGDDLVERGAAYHGGELTTYEEVWRRAPGGEPSPILVLTRDDETGTCRGALVRVGDHAIVMALTERGLAVRRERWVDAAWQMVGGIGSAALPVVPEPEPGWGPGRLVDLPGSDGWCVCELEM